MWPSGLPFRGVRLTAGTPLTSGPGRSTSRRPLPSTGHWPRVPRRPRRTSGCELEAKHSHDGLLWVGASQAQGPTDVFTVHDLLGESGRAAPEGRRQRRHPNKPLQRLLR